MKISESKCNSKTPQKIHLILIQSEIPFELTKSLALRYYFQIFTKSYRVVFEKCSLHFTSAMKISKFKCNRKTRKYPFSLIQRKFPFDCMCSMAFKSYSHNLKKKSYLAVFEKRLLYFTSPMKIFKSKCNSKTPKNPFKFD